MALTIIHTADLHARLDDATAEALGFLRARTGALLLDSGDAVAAGNVYVLPDEPVLARMSAAGYDAMALGNREFFFRKRGMLRKLAQAQFPVLCANLLPRSGDLGAVRSCITLRVGEQTVGIFGLAPTMIPPGSWGERFSDLRFIAWQDAAREVVGALRDTCDWLLTLSHRGLDDDLALAELCPEIDVILGGHTHTRQTQLVGVRPTLVAHPGHYALSVAVLRLERTAGGRNDVEARVVKLR